MIPNFDFFDYFNLRNYNLSLGEKFYTYIPYIFLVIVFFTFTFYLYFKGKHKFWLNQVINNRYDPRLWGKTGIIVGNAKLTKYFNPLCYSVLYRELGTEKKVLINEFLTKNYVYYKDLVVNMNTKNIDSIFSKHNDKCFVTLYFKNQKKNEKLIGSILSKPIEGRLYQQEIKLYYLDYLCSDPQEKNNVYFECLYTHFKRQIEQKNVKVFLFRTHKKIEIATSLITHKSNLYRTHRFPKRIFSHCKNVNFVSINSSNYRLFLKTFYKLYGIFDCFLHNNIPQLISLCDSNQFFIILILLYNKPLACYFFKNTNTLHNKMPVITMVGSYRTEKVSDELFLEGFYNSFIIIYEKTKLNWIMIDDLGYNNIIMEKLSKYDLIKTYDNYYYFYNFVYKTLNKDQVLFLL